MNVVRASVLLVVLLAGCTTGPLASEGAYLRTSLPLHEAGQGSAFTPGRHPITIAFFNASEPGMGAYAFRVGDGGTASACFVSQESIDNAIKIAYGEAFAGVLERVACADHVATAEARDEVPAGAWAFIFMTMECPHLDCTYWISQMDLPGKTSMQMVLKAEDQLGRAVQDE